MSELRLDTWEMPAADLGCKNPLPQLGKPAGPHGEEKNVGPDASEADRVDLNYGNVPGCLPYRLWHGYGRALRPRAFRTAVLENDILRATFLLELGGRMWSLVHKPSGRELLSVNPVFQPANLAVTDAWFSGGVEWNHSICGHSPFTCEPVFAARVIADDGSPILRLYEWERVRRVPYQIDFSLPDGSPYLMVRVRLTNPHEHETPMYWWSNIAVLQAEGWRVVVPADHAVKWGYDGWRGKIPIPVVGDLDTSYPAGPAPAGDFFYHIEDGQQPWITSLDPGGRGLVQTSTPRLFGRKLFRWGTGPGGKRWQNFLSPGGPPYIEIQAGLALTQGEYLPMPPGAEWCWLEAYGLMEADPAAAHGDWPGAIAEVQRRLDETMPGERLDAALAAGAAAAGRAPAEILQTASGWGALERRRRERAGEAPFCSDALPFDDATLGPEQAPWLALLEDGALPDADPADPPASWMVQPEWRRMLERAVEDGRGPHWLSWLHLGVMAYYAGDADAARQAWDRSIELAPSALARRNLAVMAMHEGRASDAADICLAASRTAPGLAPLAIECFNALIRAERFEDVAQLAGELPEAVGAAPRARVLAARAAVELGDFGALQRLIDSGIEVPDMREGEVLLSNLWYRMHEKRLAEEEGIAIGDELRERVRRDFPPPAHIDFRQDAHPGA